MAAYRQVYDLSPAGWLPRTGISTGTLHSVIEYGLPLLFYRPAYRRGRRQYVSRLSVRVCVRAPSSSAWTRPTAASTPSSVRASDAKKTVLKKKTKKMFQNVIKTFVMAPDALPLL